MEEWLQAIGLGDRIEAFRSHSITLGQVANLTDEDLRELGLTIGDRLRFRRALSDLSSAEQSAIGKANPPDDVLPIVAPTRAERRPLTVMFVDLEDFSALGERLEAEDLLDVIQRYRSFAGAAITRFGGYIARLVGDGILAYFCYPVATENDPERAVRAALEIALGIGALETPARSPLSVRIGIATGRVIVSDLFAGGQPDMRSVIGSTPNLAARLQSFAPTNGVVIAAETYARVGNAFMCESLGEREIKGFADKRETWRVIAEATLSSELRQLRRLTPFYGRKVELLTLAERWNRARVGEGGTILAVGEPGIGKSRLVEHFLAVHFDEGAKLVRLSASPFDEDSALHPVIAFIRASANLQMSEPHEVQLAKLENLVVGDVETRRDALPVIAELVGVAFDNSTLRALSPAQLRERILSVLVEQLLLQAEDRPMCLLVEDLHWLDPTSHELLGRIVEAIADRPMLLLVTTRDGFEVPWIVQRAIMVLRLAPLSPADVAEMVQGLFVNREISGHLSRAIARRTDGVPLFVEEVVRSMLATQQRDKLVDDGYSLPDQAIPASLHESLTARLDKSGRAKEVAQVVAVIGRSAQRGVIADVAGLPEITLEQGLATLSDSGLLLRSQSEGSEHYTFSHALLRDAAYDSLLREDRRALHLKVSQALTARDPETFSQQPELLAMHLTEGNEPLQAAPLWIEAARRSLARSALTESTRLLRRGLDALEKLPSDADTLEYRLTLSALLGPALIALSGPASPEAQELYGSAYALSEQAHNHPSQFPLYWGWWRVSREFHVKKNRANALLDRAVARDDPELLLQAHHCNWAAHYDAGDFRSCCSHIKRGLDIYRSGDFRHHARLYGNHDAQVCALGALAQVEWMQGRPLSGLAREREVHSWAAQMDHVGTMVHALDVMILHRSHRREHKEVFDLADQLVSLTSEHRLIDHRAKGLIFRGWAIAMRDDDPADGLRTLEEGLTRQREIGTLEDFPVYVCLHAEALARVGRPDRAVEELQRERRIFDKHGLHFWMPEVLRMLGEVMLLAAPGSVEPALSLLQEAADLAITQEVPMLGLRIALTTAQLSARVGDVERAACSLQGALSCIAEDDGGPDLSKASTLVRTWRGDIAVIPK